MTTTTIKKAKRAAAVLMLLVAVVTGEASRTAKRFELRHEAEVVTLA